MLEEHRRLLYVALTRARDRLIVCGFENKQGRQGRLLVRAGRTRRRRRSARHSRGDGRLHVIGDAADASPCSPAQAARARAASSKAGCARPRRAERRAPRLIRPFDAGGHGRAAPRSRRSRTTTRFRRGLSGPRAAGAAAGRRARTAPRVALHSSARRTSSADDAEAHGATKRWPCSTIRNSPPPSRPAAAPKSRIVADLPELGAGARVNGRIDRLAVTRRRSPDRRLQDQPPAAATRRGRCRRSTGRKWRSTAPRGKGSFRAAESPAPWSGPKVPR